ncbi:MAG TPA: response regulator [Ktedonobacteraceae bacterium]|nr:response regulator [Ktedonobacteraceae bacterium]
MKATTSKEAARILIVEDDFDIKQILGVYLKHAGFEVLSASDGSEAIQVVPEFCPDLIVLDLMMQPVDGWAVLDWLNAAQPESQPPPLSSIPVLVLTALNNLGEQVRGFEKGAIEYMTKPTQPRMIVERIRTILALSAEQRAMLHRKRIDEQRETLERVSAPQADEFVYE